MSVSNTRASVELIAWDPDSPEHQQRLFDQRVACSWNSDRIGEWQELQREGKMALYWVVLPTSLPATDKEEMLAKHIARWPAESKPLSDTATFLAGKPRAASPSTLFLPVGHIALLSVNEDLELTTPPTGCNSISNFYVSEILQGQGLGRAAMDYVEAMAASEPLCAKSLFLNTAARDSPGRIERYAAMGVPLPKVSTHDWYERRGYHVYKRVNGGYTSIDPTGKEWLTDTIYMRKDVV